MSELKFDKGAETGAVQATNDAAGKPIPHGVAATVVGGVATAVSTSAPMPVSDAGGSLTVDGTVGVSGTVAVSATSLPLPSGAATQTTLASIDTKTPALGQALAAASVPVVLTAAQVTTLTPPAAITGFATETKQPALGTAGTPSADVISVQGVSGGTALSIAGAYALASAQTVTFTASGQSVAASSNPAGTTAYLVEWDNSPGDMNCKFECQMNGATWQSVYGQVFYPSSVANAGVNTEFYTGRGTGWAIVRTEGMPFRLTTQFGFSGPDTVRVTPIAYGPAVNQPVTVSAVVGTKVYPPGASDQATNGSLSRARLGTANTTNAALINGTWGVLHSLLVSNISGSTVYIKFYNKGSAPTVGTDTPYFIVPVPAGYSGHFNFFPGVYFPSSGGGLAWGVCTGPLDSDTGAVTANTVFATAFYTG